MNKIVQVCHRYYPDIGGVETHVREISERLVKRGYEVEVVCTAPSGKHPEQECHNGVKITRFQSFAPRNAFYFSPSLYFYLKKQDYDVIHAHNYHAFAALFASVTSNGKFIFTPHYHGGSHSSFRNLLLKPYHWIGRSIFNKAEKVVCVSQYEMKLVEKDFNIPKSKLIHIPNGLDMSEFKDMGNFEKKPRNILYAGRLESYKGVQYIIEALTLLEDWNFTVIGRGGYEKTLKKLAKKLNVDDRIEWLKDLDRVEFLSNFKSAEVFVLLSTFEAYGITVAEALACGTPCIVATGGALEEFIGGMACVGLDYPIDIEKLARLIKSREKIKPIEMPDWDFVTSELVNIYSK